VITKNTSNKEVVFFISLSLLTRLCENYQANFPKKGLRSRGQSLDQTLAVLASVPDSLINLQWGRVGGMYETLEPYMHDLHKSVTTPLDSLDFPTFDFSTN